MSQSMQKQIINRVKRTTCKQPQCLSNNEDTQQVVIFGKVEALKTGLMCAQCALDSRLLQILQPIQSYAIPVRKFIKILTEQYLQYSQQKQKIQWGPNLISMEGKKIRQIFEEHEKDLRLGLLEIINYVKQCGKQVVIEIRKVHKNIQLEKICQLLEEEDLVEQERILLSKELTNISLQINLQYGVCQLKSSVEVKAKIQALIQQYRKKIGKARKALTQLIEVQKRCLKALIK